MCSCTLMFPSTNVFLYTLPDCVVHRMGRRLPLSVVHGVIGLALLGMAIIYVAVPDHIHLTPLILTLALLGKMGISSTFAIIIPFTKELVPTNIR